MWKNKNASSRIRSARLKSSLSWSVLVGLGLSWLVLVCPGLPWSALVCPGLSWSVLASPSLPWSALVCPVLVDQQKVEQLTAENVIFDILEPPALQKKIACVWSLRHFVFVFVFVFVFFLRTN